MATNSPGFWFGVSALLGGQDTAGSLVELAEGHWEDCLRCCNDAVVLKRVMGAAFSQTQPCKAALCSLASQLVNRR